MTLDDIDRLLGDWQARRQRIDDDVVALETDPVYTVLEQAQGLEGLTRERVGPALAAMTELFAMRSTFDDVLGRALGLRARVHRMWLGRRLRELEAVLAGPPAGEQLLDAMARACEMARAAAAAVGAAWDQTRPALDRARADAHRHAAAATELGVLLPALEADIDAVEALLARDPLGATEALAAVTARIAALAGQLDAARTRRQQADAALADVRAAHADAQAAAALAAGLTPPTAVAEPVSDAQIAALASGATDDPRFEGWLEAARRLAVEERATAQALRAVVDRREALRGRLEARREQVRVLRGRGLAVPAIADRQLDEAAHLLAVHPCVLAEAEAAIVALETTVRGAYLTESA